MDNSRDIARAAHLGDKPPARTQCLPYTIDHGRRTLHPVQRGIAEHGIELVMEVQALAIHHARIQAACAGRADLCRAAVDRHHFAAARQQLDGQRTVATAEVEHSLTGAWRQQIDHVGGHVDHEARMTGIVVRIPSLLAHPIHRREGSGIFPASECACPLCVRLDRRRPAG